MDLLVSFMKSHFSASMEVENIAIGPSLLMGFNFFRFQSKIFPKIPQKAFKNNSLPLQRPAMLIVIKSSQFPEQAAQPAVTELKILNKQFKIKPDAQNSPEKSSSLFLPLFLSLYAGMPICYLYQLHAQVTNVVLEGMKHHLLSFPSLLENQWKNYYVEYKLLHLTRLLLRWMSRGFKTPKLKLLIETEHHLLLSLVINLNSACPAAHKTSLLSILFSTLLLAVFLQKSLTTSAVSLQQTSRTKSLTFFNRT